MIHVKENISYALECAHEREQVKTKERTRETKNEGTLLVS